MKFINTWYPVIIAFICMLYSIGLGISGNTEGAAYSAHWPGTILLFAIDINVHRRCYYLWDIYVLHHLEYL